MGKKKKTKDFVEVARMCILRWHMGLIYAAKMHVESRKKKYITVVTKK